MGIFSFLFRSKVEYKESKQMIQNLQTWVSTHFVSGYRYPSYSQSGANRFVRLRKDNGNVISLDKIKLPQGKMDAKRVWNEIKDLIIAEDTDDLPHLIADYYKTFHQETQNFLNNLLKLDKLSDNLKSDNFFAQIDHVFYAKLKILYNELLFCKFEELGNRTYFNKITRTMQTLQKDMHTVNQAFADYMYALTKTGYENTAQEIEMIKAMVAGMSEAVEES